MIRRAEPSDLGAVLRIWLDANLDAHAFIPAEYWQGCRGLVQEMLPQAELYVHQDPAGWIDGFLGLEGNYVAGLFVRQDARSRGGCPFSITAGTGGRRLPSCQRG